jgi:hypothetical protein
MATQNMTIEHIYLQVLKTGSKVILVTRYSVIVITLHYILRYRIRLYHSIAKLSFLNVIVLGISEPLSHLKVIALLKFDPLSLLKIFALRTWHKR